MKTRIFAQYMVKCVYRMKDKLETEKTIVEDAVYACVSMKLIKTTALCFCSRKNVTGTKKHGEDRYESSPCKRYY